MRESNQGEASHMGHILVAVYGTLRQGFHNHYLLEGSRLVGSATAEFPSVMYSRGGFPILSLDDRVTRPVDLPNAVVEIFEVDSGTLHHSLDRLEGYPDWYNRSIKEFTLDKTGEKVSAWIYHQDGEHQLPIVKSNNWASK